MIDHIVQSLKNSPIAILLGVLVLLLSSFITISNGSALLSRFYHSTFGFKRKLCRNIGRLSAGVNIGHFKGILGQPVFVNTRAEDRESIFVDRYFYVQAISGSDDSVMAFSVTTRSGRFRPTLSLGPYTLADEIKRVALGKTRFAELDDFAKPFSISSSMGARRFEYYEAYYFGNPGNYQTYVLALNEAGCPPWRRWQQWDSWDEPKISDGWNSLDNAEVEAFRQRARINTYAVTAPHVSLEDIKTFSFGPDYDQVRIFEPPKAVSRRSRRRLKKVLRMGPYEWMQRRKQRHSAEKGSK